MAAFEVSTEVYRVQVPAGLMSDIVKPLWNELVTVRGKRRADDVVLLAAIDLAEQLARQRAPGAWPGGGGALRRRGHPRESTFVRRVLARRGQMAWNRNYALDGNLTYRRLVA